MTSRETLSEAMESLSEVGESPEASGSMADELRQEVVAEKGYHGASVVTDLREMPLRTFVPERKVERRTWKNKKRQKAAVYANQRRMRRSRGKLLLRKRAELVERSFEHIYDRGGMRRTHLRGHKNILKRLPIHVCGFNLGLLMRKFFGRGTPKGYRSIAVGVLDALFGLPRAITKKINRYSAIILEKMVFCASHAAA